MLEATKAPRRARRPSSAPRRAVVLAGGKGTRLAPYTSILPKPLMPIGEKAILEIIIDQLAAQRFAEVILCVGYLSHLIRSVIEQRADDNVSIRYVHELAAQGTAGPLRGIDGLDDTFIVMNGDVLTTLDYGEFVRAHEESGNALTIGTVKRTTKVNYGVLHLDGSFDPSVRRVTAYEEKPEFVSMVSMGVYAVAPHVLDYVPPEGYFDFPDLVQTLLEADQQVGSYVYDGAWFDIGRHEDYEVAVDAWPRLTANGHGAGSDGNAGNGTRAGDRSQAAMPARKS